MNWQLFVRCKNPFCTIPGQQILLPCSIPAGTDVNPPALPKDMFPARVVCRDCGHWYVYSRQDPEWGQIPSPTRLLSMVGPESWIVEIKCGIPDCNSVTKWHVRDDSGLKGAEIAKLVLGATPEIVCDHLHPLAASPESEIVKLYRA